MVLCRSLFVILLFFSCLLNCLSFYLRLVNKSTQKAYLRHSAYPSGLPSSPPVFSGVRFTRFLVLCICFVDRSLSFCSFYFSHSIVCLHSIYGFWLPLWYLQIVFLVIWQNSWLTDLSSNSKRQSADWIWIVVDIFVYLQKIKNNI